MSLLVCRNLTCSSQQASIVTIFMERPLTSLLNYLEPKPQLELQLVHSPQATQAPSTGERDLNLPSSIFFTSQTQRPGHFLSWQSSIWLISPAQDPHGSSIPFLDLSRGSPTDSAGDGVGESPEELPDKISSDSSFSCPEESTTRLSRASLMSSSAEL